MSFGTDRGIFLGCLLVLAIYTKFLRAILLTHPDLEQTFICLLGKREVQRLLGLVVSRVIYRTPDSQTWNISINLGDVTCCSPIPSNISENIRLVYFGVGWLVQYSNSQHPHESYLLYYILFVSTKIGTIAILLGGMIYGSRRMILFLTVILRVSYLQRFREQGFLRKRIMHMKGTQN